MKKNVVISRLVVELNEKYRNDNGWVYDSKTKEARVILAYKQLTKR